MNIIIKQYLYKFKTKYYNANKFIFSYELREETFLIIIKGISKLDSLFKS